jgi:hypothetical protein
MDNRSVIRLCPHQCKLPIIADAEKARQHRSRIAQSSTYRSVRLASSLAAALLNGLFEHPEVIEALTPPVLFQGKALSPLF